MEKLSFELHTDISRYLTGFDHYFYKFDSLLFLYSEWNSKINISAIRENKWIIIKHFYDSLLWNDIIDREIKSEKLKWKQVKILDIWTWWWFPLLPLSIVNEWINFIWLDSVWKKLMIINDIAENLWLKNVKTINWRAEEFAHKNEFREKFDIITERAFSPWSIMLELSVPFLKIWWLLIAYQTPLLLDIKNNKNVLFKLWLNIENIIDNKLPEDMWDRRIVLIRKVKWTDILYPRSFSLCKKDPL